MDSTRARGTVTADASGFGNAGTITGAVWKVGRFGKSLGFDGLSDWVTVAASASRECDERDDDRGVGLSDRSGRLSQRRVQGITGRGHGHSYGLYSAFGPEGPGGHVVTGAQVERARPGRARAQPVDPPGATYDGQTLRSYVDGVERAAVAATGPITLSDARAAHRRQRTVGRLLQGPHRRGAPLQSRATRG